MFVATSTAGKTSDEYTSLVINKGFDRRRGTFAVKIDRYAHTTSHIWKGGNYRCISHTVVGKAHHIWGWCYKKKKKKGEERERKKRKTAKASKFKVRDGELHVFLYPSLNPMIAFIFQSQDQCSWGLALFLVFGSWVVSPHFGQHSRSRLHVSTKRRDILVYYTSSTAANLLWQS